MVPVCFYYSISLQQKLCKLIILSTGDLIGCVQTILKLLGVIYFNKHIAHYVYKFFIFWLLIVSCFTLMCAKCLETKNEDGSKLRKWWKDFLPMSGNQLINRNEYTSACHSDGNCLKILVLATNKANLVMVMVASSLKQFRTSSNQLWPAFSLI